MPANRPLHVIALFHAKPGFEAELRELTMSLIEPTRAEVGCLRYELIEDPRNPAELTFVEEWESEEALTAHLDTPHLVRAKSRFDEILEGGLQLRRGYAVAQP